MRPSRGMGNINPSKVPKTGTQSKKTGTRKDGDKFDMYAEGGEVKMSGGGLYANIAAKKRRIASGSGESMKAAGAEGAPKKRDFDNAAKTARFSPGGKTKSKVNEAGNYTKPELRKRIFNRIKAGGKGGNPGQWSARKAQMMAKEYKKSGGGYRD